MFVLISDVCSVNPQELGGGKESFSCKLFEILSFTINMFRKSKHADLVVESLLWEILCEMD